MAGLSIKRRRKAWEQGVITGAGGKARCFLQLPKLLEIFQRGVEYGQQHAHDPQIISMVEKTRLRAQKALAPRPPARRPPRPMGGGGGYGGGGGGYGGPRNRGSRFGGRNDGPRPF